MISRCLAPFADRIAHLPREEWRAAVMAMPVKCPHTDCSPGANCLQVCTEYARMQWRLSEGKTSIPKSKEARKRHLKTLLENAK